MSDDYAGCRQGGNFEILYCIATSSVMDICTSNDVKDIEDLTLPDGVDARQNKKYVFPRASKHKTSTKQQTCADSVIPGI